MATTTLVYLPEITAITPTCLNGLAIAASCYITFIRGLLLAKAAWRFAAEQKASCRHESKIVSITRAVKQQLHFANEQAKVKPDLMHTANAEPWRSVGKRQLDIA